MINSDRKEKHTMKNVLLLSLAALFLFSCIMVGIAKGEGYSGETEFKKHCEVCHPDGGNIINSQKTLHKKDLESNNITKPEDIIKKMRNPGPGMTQFDKETIPDSEAREIAKYILKTFK
jgi:cytochrome c6